MPNSNHRLRPAPCWAPPKCAVLSSVEVLRLLLNLNYTRRLSSVEAISNTGRIDQSETPPSTGSGYFCFS